MSDQQQLDHFIGRTREIETFTQWLEDPDAPKILYIHDIAEEADKKGGVGKTWLMRRCAEIAREKYQDIAVVTADFFNVGDRDRIFLAEKIITGLQELYPSWSPNSLIAVTQQYRSETSATSGASDSISISLKIREEVAAALVDDLQNLSDHFTQDQKMLLVFLDTFETIEQNPSIAVLRQSQVFPDNYQLENMRIVIAGRNKLDWSQPNWRDREQEVLVLPLNPFSQEEMLEFVGRESPYRLSPASDLAIALYERTEGRPIIIGLAVDVVNHRILTLPDLVAVNKSEFEAYLVPQINKLENPLNWVILFMAHAYHRFNMPLLEWILQRVAVSEQVRSFSQEKLLSLLPTLSFIRQSGTGNDFVLHDEMQRLVTKYCWGVQDTDRRFRRDISRSVISYYERELKQTLNEQQRQGYIIEILYHRLFVDLDDGLNYFQQQFNEAVRLLKNAFARLLLQEVQKFSNQLSLAQSNELLYSEGVLLRSEESPQAALSILQRLRQGSDPQWYARRLSSILIEEGRCYMQQSRLADASRSLTQALEIEQSAGRELQGALLLNNLGSIYRRRGQFSTALGYYEQSIAIYKRLGRQRDYASTLTNISNIYRLQGKIEEARRRCKVALSIRLKLFQEGSISEMHVGLSLHALGVIYLNANNITEAEKLFQEAFDIFLRVNYKTGIAIIYNRFGQTQLQKGDLAGAREWFVKAQEASRETDIEQYINSLNKQGRISALQEEWTEAADFFERAIEFARQVPDYYQETESLIDLADASDYLARKKQSQQFLQEAEDIAARENYPYLSGLIEKTRGEIDYRVKEYKAAFQHFVLYCQWMARYNNLELDIAVQKVIDALLGVPENMAPVFVQEMITYWKEQHLDQHYPALIQAFEEIDTLMAF
jgi:tetratricopeptide (TPR) repeat protein